MGTSFFRRLLKWKAKSQTRTRRNVRSLYGKLRVEQLEDRLVPAPVLTLNVTPPTVPEGTAVVNFSLGTVTDTQVGNTAFLMGQVDWGDGTAANPDITGVTITQTGPHTFAVSGTHAYTQDGSYTATVSVIDAFNFTTPATKTATITVTDADASITGQTISVNEGQTIAAQRIAFLNDPDSTRAGGSYTATINWGDGTTTPADTVFGFPGGPYAVVGTHTYADDGAYTITVTASELGQQIATGTSTAIVAEDDLTGGVNNFFIGGTNVPFVPSTPNLFKATIPEGQALSTNIAEVYDGLLAIPIQNAKATIAWGDGTTTAGTVITTPLLATGGGGVVPFTGNIISGAHTYADEGVYTITVTFSETDNNGTPLPGGTVTFTATETVTDADTLAPAAGVTQPTIGTPTQPLMVGTAFSGPVGVFSDTGYPGQARADLQATINWGDGSFGNGTITKDPNTGLFTVSGKHTYTTPGTFPVSVALADDIEGVPQNPPGVVHTTATISNGAAMVSVSPVLTAEGLQAALTATLTDPNAINAGSGLPNPPSAYAATVNWGDGMTSAGTVTGPNGGPYTVSGSHTYSIDGSYTVTVSVTEPGVLPVPLASASATATVADDNLTATAIPVSATEGAAFTGPVGTFVDPGAVQVLNTVPGNGDVNPYGLAVVPPSFPNTGMLQPGDILVANFNNAANVQGTGTTITRINAEGQSSTFFTSSLPGLSTALGVLKSGFVIVGNVPNDGAGNVLPGSLQVLDKNGNAVNVPGLNALITDPWDLTINDQGNTAQVYVSNTSGATGPNGNVVRIDLKINNGTITVVDEVQVGSGYATRLDAAAFVLGPGGLAFDPNTHTLYVASQDELVGGAAVGTIFGIANADTATSSNGTGAVVYADPAHLHGPIGLVQLPNGDLVTANSDAVNTDPNQPSELVEFTTAGQFVGQFSMDPANGGAFGIATGAIGGISKFIAVDDNNASVTVFNFAPTSPTVNDFGATINWGDGTTGAGTVTFSGNGTPAAVGGNFTVSSSHTYADEGSYSTSLLVTENGVASAYFAFLDGVNQVPPVATPGVGVGGVILSADQTTVTFSTQFAALSSNATAAHLHNAPAGQNGPVALDAGGNKIELANLPSATGGTAGPQTFTITPAFVSQFFQGNIYENIHTINNPSGEIRGQFLPPNVSTAAATIGEADAFSNLQVVPGPVTEGANTPQVVAAFSDTGYPTQVASDLTASINWGDGTAANPDITTGTIAATGNGNFTVTGGHAYAVPGSYTVSVTVNDGAPGTATASATGTIKVVSVAALNVTAVPVTGTEGTAFSGPVATFTTPNLLAIPGNFSATVLWGDLNQSPPPPVTITGGNGTFTVSSSHFYTTEGPFTFTVLVSENAPGTATGKANGTATMADADAFTITVTPPAGAVVGTALTNVQVATFADTGYPSNAASDLQATITWGDGGTSLGAVTSTGGGNFQVTGSHTYTLSGALTLGVQIKDIDGTATALNSATIHVASTDVLSVTGTKNLSFAEGSATSSGVVATFTDTITVTPATAFTATIAWGDGTTSAGTVTGSNGNFTVTAGHAYAEESGPEHANSNPYQATVTISGAGAVPVSATSTITVAEVPVTATGVQISASEGAAFTGTVATFVDPAGPEALSDYSATIAWGDGATSTGSISVSGNTFTVAGTHTYAEESGPEHAGSNPYAVAVTITHEGTTSIAGSTATVAEVPVSVTGTTIAAVSGTSFTQAVATFTDPGGPEALADYSANIAWGDGATSNGTISVSGNTFTVTGTHTYPVSTNAVTYAAVVTVTHEGTTATANTTANASATLPGNHPGQVLATGVAFSAVQGVAFTQAVATFTDPAGPGSTNSYVAVINWGDHTSSTGKITRSGNTFTVTGSHVYTSAATFTISISISHKGVTTPVTSTANVASASAPTGLNFSNGFAGSTSGLTYNGSAKLNGSAAQLTDGGKSEAGSFFANAVQTVSTFNTQFTFQTSAGPHTADGFTFTIQGNSPTALGRLGGGLGYGPDHVGGTGGIPKSVAIKFDLLDNQGEGNDSTGLYVNGAAPTDVGSIDLSSTGINLHSGDVFYVDINYNGTTLNVTIVDTKTGAFATQTYTVNIPALVGGNTAYVGFTGGSGDLTATQKILTWTF